MPRIDTLAAALILTAATAGAQSLEPVLVPLGSSAVVDTDTLFLAVPIGIAVGAHGTVYVIERDEKRVLEIDSAGVIRRVFGRAGRGPGEFESPSTMTVSGDTLLAVYDRAVRRVTLIDLRTWKHTAIVPLQSSGPPSMQFVGPEILVRVWDTDGGTSHATVDLTGRILSREGTIPPIGKKHAMLVTGVPWEDVLAVRGNDVIAMFALSPMLYRWPRGSLTATAIPVPKEKRFSVSDEYFERLMRDPGRAQEFFWDRSIPLALDFVSASIAGVVTMDLTVRGETKSHTYHLTLVDLERSRACVDIEVPTAGVTVSMRDPSPNVALRRDQLILLEPAPDATGEPVPTIRRFGIRPDACRSWVPLR
jgi:hypothetical protein